jgi:hypothetical protein
MLISYNKYVLVTMGVAKGIRVYSNIFSFKIGGILNIEFLYFTIIKNMETQVCTFYV